MDLHGKYSNYRYCIDRDCKNTSIKTPEKLWIRVPINMELRNTWIKLANRDPESFAPSSRLYLCEDHFDLKNDMENYVQYQIMGSVKQIKLKPNCVPSKFSCQIGRKRKLTPELSTATFHEELINERTATSSSTSSCKKYHDKAVQVIQHNTNFSSQAIQVQPLTADIYCQTMPSYADKVVQVSLAKQYRSKAVQFRTTAKDALLSPIKIYQQSTATSPMKPSMTGQSSTRKLFFTEEKYDSDHSYTLSQESIDSSKQSGQNTDDSLPEKITIEQSLHLQSTLSKIIKNPRLYIGIPKELYFIIQIISKHTNISENHILLCLMKLRLNRTFSQLADDFNMSPSQAGKIFNSKLPGIANVLFPFVKTFTKSSIKKNLPIAFRQKYYNVTSIIDCLEIEIQKPSKAIHQALTWSDYKKANTIKYLISCTPDGLVSFVSKGYGGRVSDVNLLEDSQFLNTLEPNSCILADRGFKHIEVYLKQRGFTLLRPPSVAGGVKLTKSQVKETKEIASLRIHVERVIRRLREFAILKPHSVVNLKLFDKLDLCIMSACALINLQDSIIK